MTDLAYTILVFGLAVALMVSALVVAFIVNRGK